MKTLSRVLFGRRLWPGQAQIAALTAFQDHKRAAACCYTQYGKTFGFGTGLGVDLVMDLRPRKVALVGPTAEQAKKIRQEFLGAALASPLAVRELGLTRRGAERMQEKSVNRFVTRHRKEYRVLTTGKDARAGEGLMGHGVDSTAAPPESGELDVDDEEEGAAGLVVVTEAGLIPEPAWPKITRMLGDDGILVVEGNPWSKGTGFHRFWTAPGTFRVHIDVEQGIREGRISRERAEEERRGMPPLFWIVLYLSLFPDTAEDQVIPWGHIDRATKPHAPLPAPVRRYGLDVAEGGADMNVLTPIDVDVVYGKENYRVQTQVAWSEADTMATVDLAAAEMRPGSVVIVDAVGPGKGVADGLKRHPKRFVVKEFRAGASARQDDRYRNMGSEAYWMGREAFEEDRIQIPDEATLKAELQQPKWKTDDRRVIVDKKGAGSKSPDRADSLVMGLHGGERKKKLGVG